MKKKTAEITAGISVDQVAVETGVTRFTQMRWADRKLIPRPTQIPHPSGRGRHGVYPGGVVERVRRIAELSGHGVSAASIKATLWRDDFGAAWDEAQEIVEAWNETWLPRGETLKGTEIVIRAGRTRIKHSFPISSHVDWAIRERLSDLGVEGKLVQRIVASLSADRDALRVAIATLLLGFSPVLIFNGERVFIAPDFALAWLHTWREWEETLTQDEYTASSYEEAWRSFGGLGYLTLHLYPILRTVWQTWGKRPVPQLKYVPGSKAVERIGHQFIESDVKVDLTPTAVGHLVPVLQPWTARVGEPPRHTDATSTAARGGGGATKRKRKSEKASSGRNSKEGGRKRKLAAARKKKARR